MKAWYAEDWRFGIEVLRGVVEFRVSGERAEGGDPFTQDI